MRERAAAPVHKSQPNAVAFCVESLTVVPGPLSLATTTQSGGSPAKEN